MEKISKKNNITISLLFIAFVFAMIFSCVFVCLSPNTTVLAETSTSEETQEEDNSDEKIEEILNFLNISQEDYVFQKEDFVSNHTSWTTKEENCLAVFSNRTITISMKDIEIEGVQTKLGTVRINSNTATPTTINGKDYFVVSPSASEDSETRVYVEVSQTYPKTPSKPNGETITHNLLFFVVQTPTDFEKESSNKNFIKWTYCSENVDYSPTAPETDQIYETIILSFPSGTTMNPISVEFVYCGEFYKILRYTENGTVKTINALNNQELDIDYLVFSSSGKYVVRIYDNTINSQFPNKNYLEYSFEIRNKKEPNSSFYIYTHTNDGTNLMSGQYTNEDVIVDFINFDKFKDKVDEISIIRAYQPSISENISEEKKYKPNELEPSISFIEDGTYEIKFLGKNEEILAKYEFTITKSIKNSFRIGDKDYVIADNDESNTTKEFEITYKIGTSYVFKKVFYSESEGKFEKQNGDFKTGDQITIDGETSFNFNLTVARSEPNIFGVSNNQRTQNNVNLRVYGVGTIDVYVTLNGTQMMIENEYVNGEKLPTFTEQGKYFIRITDEMGSTVTKSFSITLKLNTASVILIALACIIVFVILVFFIISRGKVKVR